MLPYYYISMFKFITQAVLDDHDWGDAFIQCKAAPVQEVADLFEEFLREEGIDGFIREEDETSCLVVFSRGQESFVFVSAHTPGLQLEEYHIVTVRIVV